MAEIVCEFLGHGEIDQMFFPHPKMWGSNCKIIWDVKHPGFHIADATCSQSRITIIMILDTQIPDWTLLCNFQVLHNLCEISWDVKHKGFHNCRCNLQPVSNYHHPETGHPNPRLNTLLNSQVLQNQSHCICTKSLEPLGWMPSDFSSLWLLGLRVFFSAWILVDKHRNENTIRKTLEKEKKPPCLPPN
jgi:hypothetical protein